MKKHVCGVVEIGDPYLILSYWYKMYKTAIPRMTIDNLFILQIAVLRVCLKMNL